MKIYSLLSIACFVVVVLAFTTSNVTAQTTPTISYQGLLEENGVPMNGQQTLKILIYTAATGGTPFYSETQSIDVTNGIFNIAIGSVTPLLPRLDFRSQYYLAISVNGAAELSPRSQVSFAPYAFRALNADTASYSSTAEIATTANRVAGGVVTNVNGFYGPLTLSGTNGITITNSPGNITIGNSGVESVNTAGGKLTLVGTGGTTITDTGTTITIHSATFTGGTGIQTVQNSDSSITVTNENGPSATISLGKQNASSGQVLEWNGSAWRPTTLSSSQGGPDSINDLADARSFGYNVFLGGQSGKNDRDSSNGTNGNYNTAIGISALQDNTTGYQNTACGAFSLVQNTTGYFNTAVGELALFTNDTGVANTAVGYYALSHSTGSGNVAVGGSALEGNTTGNQNTAMGEFAMTSNGVGSLNTAIGRYSLDFNTSGSSNVSVGSWALYGNTSGNSNIAVGDSSGPMTGNLNNTICIGSSSQATSSNQVVLGNSNVTSLYCQGAYAATTANSANLVVLSTGQIARSTSSARYKTNIHDLDINTDRLYDLRPVSYTSKIDGKQYFGLVAEDVAKVVPELAEYARAKDVIPGSTSDALIPDAVKYPMLSVLLLNELKKEHAEAEMEAAQLESQARTIAQIELRLEALEAAQRTTR